MDYSDLLEKIKRLPESNQQEVMKIVEAGMNTNNTSVQLEFVFGDDEHLSLSDDRADRSELVKLVAKQIASENSFRTYSINGPWGSGKSVFLQWLHKELKENHKSEVLSVYFRAWKYQATQNLVYALIHQFKEEKKGKDFNNKVDRVLKLTGQIGVLGLAGHQFGTAGIAGWRALLSMMADFFKDTREKKVIGAIEELEKEFCSLVEYVLDAYDSHPKKVVFLVDELDRCSIENVVVLLESIKNILQPSGDSKSHGFEAEPVQSPKVVFVFAIDKTVVSQSIKMRYGNLPSFDGEDYLEKVIEFSFELPFDPISITQGIHKYFSTHFPNILGINLEFVPEMVKRSGIRSIRSLKKVFSRFATVNQLLLVRGTRASYNPQSLFIALFVYELYPRVYTIIKESGDYTLFTWIQNVPYKEPAAGRRPHYQHRIMEETENTTFQRVMSYLGSEAAKSHNVSLDPKVMEDCMKVLDLVGS